MDATLLNEIESELKNARTSLVKSSEGLKAATVKSMRFYHSSRTRHHALIFKLDNGETVYKGLHDNALEVTRSFTTARQVTIWYDEQKIVQQYVLSYEF